MEDKRLTVEIDKIEKIEFDTITKGPDSRENKTL